MKDIIPIRIENLSDSEENYINQHIDEFGILLDNISIKFVTDNLDSIGNSLADMSIYMFRLGQDYEKERNYK